MLLYQQNKKKDKLGVYIINRALQLSVLKKWTKIQPQFCLKDCKRRALPDFSSLLRPRIAFLLNQTFVEKIYPNYSRILMLINHR